MVDMESLHLGRPYAIMMVGVPGSGKSFFASQFAETFHAPYVDSLAIETLSRDGDAAGELISIFLGELVKTHQSFVFEGNSDSRVRRTEFARWARAKGYQPLFIWVQADQRTALKRSLKSGMTRDTFEAIMREFSAPHEDEKAIVISGRHTYASQARVVLAALSKDARPAQPVVVVPAKPTASSPIQAASTPRTAMAQPPHRNVIVR
jgi:gluconate kinase